MTVHKMVMFLRHMYNQGVGRNLNCCLEVEKLAEDVVQMTYVFSNVSFS